jgi:hypothetical protein
MADEEESSESTGYDEDGDYHEHHHTHTHMVEFDISDKMYKLIENFITVLSVYLSSNGVDKSAKS